MWKGILANCLKFYTFVLRCSLMLNTNFKITEAYLVYFGSLREISLPKSLFIILRFVYHLSRSWNRFALYVECNCCISQFSKMKFLYRYKSEEFANGAFPKEILQLYQFYQLDHILHNVYTVIGGSCCFALHSFVWHLEFWTSP